MAWFNETAVQFYTGVVGKLWEKSVSDEWTPTGFTYVLLYMVYASLPILIFSVCSVKIFQIGIKAFIEVFEMLKDFYPEAHEHMDNVISCQRIMLDGYWFMFYNVLTRPLYPLFYAVRYITYWCFDKISSRCSRRDEQISNVDAGHQDEQISKVDAGHQDDDMNYHKMDKNC